MSTPLRTIRLSLTKSAEDNIISLFVGKSLSESDAAVSIDQIILQSQSSSDIKLNLKAFSE